MENKDVVLWVKCWKRVPILALQVFLLLNKDWRDVGSLQEWWRWKHATTI